MRDKSSAFTSGSIPVSAMWWAAGGVLAFSGTVPATVLALRGFDPLVVGAGRSVLAAVLAAGCLLLTRSPLPERRQWPGLAVVAAGCGVGFGVLSAIALGHVTASHAAVVIGLLPVATAAYAVGRTGERVGGRFWAASLAGAGVVIVYAVTEGAGSVRGADALLLVALVVGAAGYAEGGRLARQMPGWRVIAWGLLLALPVCLPLTGLALAVRPVHASAGSISGLAYVSAISMFLGFFAWFRGLGAAGVARASQLQLLQPFLTVAWSALLLGERPGPATLGAALLVLVCVAASQRSRFTAVATATPAAEAVAVAAVR